MNQLGMNASISNVYDAYLRPLNKQGIVDYCKSVLNGKENLYYPSNLGKDSESFHSILPLTEDCRLILNQPFDEKKVLEESIRTLLRRRSNGGEDKYKIIDIDGSEIDIDKLLEKYFFNENYHTSCSVIFTKLYNNSIKHYSIVDEQAKDIENPLNKAEDDVIDSITLPDSSTNYSYTKEDIENFFTSDNGQKEDHIIKESICLPLIGRQNPEPYFYFCKEHPKVENINLISIESHIRLAEPERHKAKLLEYLEKEKENND